jgi:hypothetical protein
MYTQAKRRPVQNVFNCIILPAVNLWLLDQWCYNIQGSYHWVSLTSDSVLSKVVYMKSISDTFYWIIISVLCKVVYMTSICGCWTSGVTISKDHTTGSPSPLTVYYLKLCIWKVFLTHFTGSSMPYFQKVYQVQITRQYMMGTYNGRSQISGGGKSMLQNIRLWLIHLDSLPSPSTISPWMFFI